MSREGSDELSFDAVVDNLSQRTQSQYAKVREDEDPFAEVRIHTGVGFDTSFLQLHPEIGGRREGSLNGVEANLGIDLFSPSWQAEGAIRSFDTSHVDREIQAQLKEFDLRVLYTGGLNSFLHFHMGLGLAARYLHVQSSSVLFASQDYVTPSSLLSCGLSSQLSKVFSVGVDLSMRRSLTKETIDYLAFNGSLRLNAHF